MTFIDDDHLLSLVLVLTNGYVVIRIALIVERQLLLMYYEQRQDVGKEHVHEEIFSELLQVILSNHQHLNNHNFKMNFVSPMN